MELQVNPNQWSCYPTAAAMVIDMPVKKLISLIGHDGSELAWPMAKYPHIGFHEQELAEVLLTLGYYMITFDGSPYKCEPAYNASCPLCAGTGMAHIKDIKTNYKKFLDHQGILVFQNHACAWDGNKVYDPKGFIYDLDPSLLMGFDAIIKSN